MGFNCVVNSLRFMYFQVNCGLNIALEHLGTRLVYNYDLLIIREKSTKKIQFAMFGHSQLFPILRYYMYILNGVEVPSIAGGLKGS